jgi:peptidoglycan hydrolase CwlO-like protein
MTNHEKQIQSLQDMLNGAINQRNAAQNECLQLSRDLRGAQREVEALTEQVNALTKKLEEPAAGDKSAESTPKANGHAEEMSAA